MQKKILILKIFLLTLGVNNLFSQVLGYDDMHPLFMYENDIVKVGDNGQPRQFYFFEDNTYNYIPLLINDDFVISSATKNNKCYIVLINRNLGSKMFLEIDEIASVVGIDLNEEYIFYTDINYQYVKKINIESKKISNFRNGILRAVIDSNLYYSKDYKDYGGDECTNLYLVNTLSKKNEIKICNGAWDDKIIVSPNENFIVCDLCFIDRMEKVLYNPKNHTYLILQNDEKLFNYFFTLDESKLIYYQFIEGIYNSKVINLEELMTNSSWLDR